MDADTTVVSLLTVNPSFAALKMACNDHLYVSIATRRQWAARVV